MTSASDFVILAPMNHFKQSCLLDFFAFFSSKDHVALWHNCSFVSLAGVSPNFASQFSKNPPPRTPDKCDPDLSFDAVSELQQELLFFKGRYGGHHQAWQTRCQLEHHSEKNCGDHTLSFQIHVAQAPKFHRNRHHSDQKPVAQWRPAALGRRLWKCAEKCYFVFQR